MTTTIEISDDLARAIERHRQSRGLATIEAAAEAVIELGLEFADDDPSRHLDADALRALIDEGEASGQAKPWNSEEVFGAIRANYEAAQKK